jgi:hypothetical protein
VSQERKNIGESACNFAASGVTLVTRQCHGSFTFLGLTFSCTNASIHGTGMLGNATKRSLRRMVPTCWLLARPWQVRTGRTHPFISARRAYLMPSALFPCLIVQPGHRAAWSWAVQDGEGLQLADRSRVAKADLLRQTFGRQHAEVRVRT